MKEQRLEAELIALNAAFEAARMGEAGKPFALRIEEFLHRRIAAVVSTAEKSANPRND